MSSEKFYGVGKINWKIRQRKTAFLNNAEKKTLSKAKDKLVVEIPFVRGFRPIVVEPETVVIPGHIEHFRIAIGIGFICRAIHSTACSNTNRRRSKAVFYLGAKLRQRGIPSYIFLESLTQILHEKPSYPMKSRTSRSRSQSALARKVSKSSV
jgi:hypothetical protein